MTVLVLDIGSSSTRALLFDDHAHAIPGAVVQRQYQMKMTPPGAATLDALFLRGAVEATIDEILAHPAAQNIRVVGLATLVGNLLGLDADGNPLTPIYLYADTRSAEDVEVLRSEVNAAASHERTGCPLAAAYHPARLHWLARTDSHTYNQVRLWTDFAGYLYHHWFGQTACSYSVASWSGLLNRAALDWDSEWLEHLSISPSLLLPLHDYHEFSGALKPPYHTRWQALSGVPFCLAVGDGAAANVGAGCVDQQRIAMSLGTTAAIRVTYPTRNDGDVAAVKQFSELPEPPLHQPKSTVPSVPYGLWSYRISAGLHLIGGATSEGGNLYHWARETLQLPANLMDELANRPVDGHGLTILPLLAGERSPGWSSDATGAIAGLRLSTTPLDIVQALFESLALRLAIIYEQLGGFIHGDTAISASGGALSPYLAQTIAHALNHSVGVTEAVEITARGVALLALRAIGVDITLDDPPAVAYVKNPLPDAAARLQNARERQTALYRTIIQNQHWTN